MFSKLPKVNFKLTILFTLSLIFFAIIMLGATTGILYSTLKNEEYDFLRMKMLGLWAHYQTGSIESLLNELRGAGAVSRERNYLLRFATAENETVFLTYPTRWQDFHPEELKLLDLSADTAANDAIITLESEAQNYTVEVLEIPLDENYMLQAGISTETRDLVMSNSLKTSFLILIPIILIAAIFGLVFSNRALHPIQVLSERISHIIDTGDFSSRVPEVKTKDNLAELVDLVNSMLRQIEDLITGMKSTVDTVAHDIRTPMTRLRGISELALAEVAKDNHSVPTDNAQNVLRSALETSLEESESVLKLLNALLDIAQAESGTLTLEKTSVNLTELCDSVMDLYEIPAEEKQIELSLEAASDISIVADPFRLRQALANLLDNAVKYSPEDSLVEIVVKSRPQGGAVITICDEGPGIPAGENDNIWRRLYRGTNVGSSQGLGIGLSVVKAVVEAHGGTVSAENRHTDETSLKKTGAIFSITLL